MAGPTSSSGGRAAPGPRANRPQSGERSTASPSGNTRPRGGPGPRPGGSSGSQRASSSGSRPKPRPRNRRNILWRMRRVFFLLGLVAMVGVAAAAAAISQMELTDPTELLQTSYICTGDLESGECTASNAIAQLSEDENRTFVPLEEMPDHLINAVIAMEDRDFWDHQGVSLPAIARALFQDLRGAGVQQGGSTITQQYIKVVYLTNDR